MKKYSYELIDIDKLFQDKMNERNPEGNPIIMAKHLTDIEKTVTFQEILNDYGENGWRYHGQLNTDLTQFHIFEKEVYGKKSE